MLSPFVPAWLIVLISPLLAFLGPRIPPAIKPVAAFLVAIGVVIYTVLASPLTWVELIPQAILLYGMVIGGYTAAKGIDRLSIKPVLTACLLGMTVLGVGTAMAQPEGAPVATTIYIWSQWGLAWLGGAIARALKKLPF